MKHNSKQGKGNIFIEKLEEKKENYPLKIHGFGASEFESQKI